MTSNRVTPHVIWISDLHLQDYALLAQSNSEQIGQWNALDWWPSRNASFVLVWITVDSNKVHIILTITTIVQIHWQLSNAVQ